MCIAFLATENSSNTAGYDLVVAFNRDEYFSRPTQGFHIWQDNPSIYAPQDLQPPNPSYRGSWIGINKQGRMAFLTNFREATFHHDSMISRGALIRDFLMEAPKTPANGYLVKGPRYAREYAQMIYNERHRYDGFSLVLVDMKARPVEIYYVTNRGYVDNKGIVKAIGQGKSVVGISNSVVDEPWPKVIRGKREFERILGDAAKKHGKDDRGLVEELMRLMRDKGCEFPVPERIDDLKQHMFIPVVDGLGGDIAPGAYGTRSTAVVLLRNNLLTVAEREYTVESSSLAQSCSSDAENDNSNEPVNIGVFEIS
ncbi:hypothetical protein LPJ64_003045 [Coemansia asiatica]|uniref:DUF833-domain-containing protein n=1 Tax=Coemansia asiatica TaxID=1052880 RepID=A0A9W8CJX8_9FUNG|nr:hypothetical protein LPJ64_003045 [Coemansia asiatica]